MDLVYASDSHYRGGPPLLDPISQKAAFKSILYTASKRLQDVHIPADRPNVIAGAKVPIIKFKDRLTGIDVDISFENLSGVQAQATFDKWKRDYPDMMYMVALVKQFLAMRGLNEVHTGGIGGFTVICLIVNYIHLEKKPDNLGSCFVGFLEYYGKIFDLAKQRIQMNPPAVIPKDYHGVDGYVERADGLSIQDPNRLNNNISGGSRKAPDVFRAFSAAHDTLTDRMHALKGGLDIGHSLLECILGGNYETYMRQRHLLKSLK
jgi:non-canonical poly(A) RNA polymerase PAPD5/7